MADKQNATWEIKKILAGIGVGLLVLIIAGIGVTVFSNPPEPYGGASVDLQQAVATPTDVAPESDLAPTVAANNPQSEGAPGLAAPTFDVLRVDASGAAVIAGTSRGSVSVEFLLDGKVVDVVKTSRAGKFTGLFDIEPSPEARILTAVAVAADGRRTVSDQTLLVNPIEAPTPPLVVATAPEVASPEIAKPDLLSAQNIAPMALSGKDGVKLLQPAPQPAGPGPDVETNVVIDTISYDTKGEVALTGRGAADRFVRVYLNERPIQNVEINADGTWDAPLSQIDAGVYRLRVDEVSAAGEVTSRVETPFQREEALLAAKSVTAITVQPGFTLWAIAQDKFGSGEQYVRVYNANRDLIRDPNLIYPGQVFALPDG